ncbi:protein of unknown function [Clostridium beijerinckii]|nr:protein of unknown function [Clostridium beijerinckii]
MEQNIYDFGKLPHKFSFRVGCLHISAKNLNIYFVYIKLINLTQSCNINNIQLIL